MVPLTVTKIGYDYYQKQRKCDCQHKGISYSDQPGNGSKNHGVRSRRS